MVPDRESTNRDSAETHSIGLYWAHFVCSEVGNCSTKATDLGPSQPWGLPSLSTENPENSEKGVIVLPWCGEFEVFYCRKRSQIASNRFSELCRWTLKNIRSKIFDFFLPKKKFKKISENFSEKIWKFWLFWKSRFFRKNKKK